MTTPTRIAIAAVTVGVALSITTLGLTCLLAWWELSDRRKDGVARREVVHLYPEQLRRFADWRAMFLWALPKVFITTAAVVAAISIFVVGLMEVFG